MKGLTLWQPWATLWARQLKINETRSWSTSYSGRLAVHAAKNTPLEEFKVIEVEPFRSTVIENRLIPFPRGSIIAVCDRVICRPVGKALGEMPREKHFLETAFGNFDTGRFAWLPVNMRMLETPILCRGALGLWDVPPDVLKQIEAQL